MQPEVILPLIAYLLVVFGFFHFYPTRYLLGIGWSLLVIGIFLSGFVSWGTAAMRLCMAVLTLVLMNGSHGSIVAGGSIVLGIFGLIWTIGRDAFFRHSGRERC